jgi:hypothetical protein
MRLQRPQAADSSFLTRITLQCCSSPLVHDAAAMEALNLNPGAPRVDHRARAAFEEFKAREAADKAKRE